MSSQTKPAEDPQTQSVDIEKFLSKADSKLGKLIKVLVPRIGKLRIPAPELPPFEALVLAIVNQQLSNKAAAAIYKKLQAAVRGRLTPAKLLALSPEQLRTVGLSRAKAKYLHNLADWFTTNRKVVKQLPMLSDNEVIAAVTSISGIGVWTAQVFLIFNLGRLDVVPALDLGIQRGVQLVYNLKVRPPPDVVLKKALQWQPYRSIASLYLWQSFRQGITVADLG